MTRYDSTLARDGSHVGPGGYALPSGARGPVPDARR